MLAQNFGYLEQITAMMRTAQSEQQTLENKQIDFAAFYCSADD